MKLNNFALTDVDIDKDRAETILKSYLRLYEYGVVGVSEYANLFLLGFKFFDKYQSIFEKWWNSIAELKFSDGAKIMLQIAQAEYFDSLDPETGPYVSHLHIPLSLSLLIAMI